MIINLFSLTSQTSNITRKCWNQNYLSNLPQQNVNLQLMKENLLQLYKVIRHLEERGHTTTKQRMCPKTTHFINNHEILLDTNKSVNPISGQIEVNTPGLSNISFSVRTFKIILENLIEKDFAAHLKDKKS
jgi:hypothetical protein